MLLLRGFSLFILMGSFFLASVQATPIAFKDVSIDQIEQHLRETRRLYHGARFAHARAQELFMALAQTEEERVQLFFQRLGQTEFSLDVFEAEKATLPAPFDAAHMGQFLAAFHDVYLGAKINTFHGLFLRSTPEEKAPVFKSIVLKPSLQLIMHTARFLKTYAAYSAHFFEYLKKYRRSLDMDPRDRRTLQAKTFGMYYIDITKFYLYILSAKVESDDLAAFQALYNTSHAREREEVRAFSKVPPILQVAFVMPNLRTLQHLLFQTPYWRFAQRVDIPKVLRPFCPLYNIFSVHLSFDPGAYRHFESLIGLRPPLAEDKERYTKGEVARQKVLSGTYTNIGLMLDIFVDMRFGEHFTVASPSGETAHTTRRASHCQRCALM